MKESLSKDILSIFDWFEEKGYEIYLVGGCVRDYLRKEVVHDYDFTTNATPEEMIDVLTHTGGKIIPTGLKHGTITFLYNEVDYEITTYRSETDYTDHRAPSSVHFVKTLIEDLKRRDFTMNAVCYRPSEGFVDPLDGMSDILNKRIQCIGDPKERFNEDALRTLRALRFKYQFKFDIEDSTLVALKEQADLLRYISKERIQREWNQMLMSEFPMLLSDLREVGVLYYIFDELRLLETLQETPWHAYDVFTHTDIVLTNTVNEDLVFKLAAVFHDIGKKDSKTFDDNGVAHFYGHAAHSIQLTKHALLKLKYPKKIIADVCEIISYHDYYFNPNEKSVRKFLAKLNQDVQLADTILRFQLSDNAGKNLDFIQGKSEAIEQSRIIIHELEMSKSLISRQQLAINGNDLVNLNVEKKEIGLLLDRCYQYVTMNPNRNHKDTLLQLVKQWIL